MKTSQEIAVDWLPILLSDDRPTVAFMQEVAAELLNQAGAREALELRLGRIQREVKSWAEDYT